MNTTQFTYRDFVTYFLTGVIFLLGLGLIFFDPITDRFTVFFKSYRIIDEFKILVTIASIGVIYFIGHVVHWVDYALMQMYVSLYKFNEKFKYKILYRIRKLLEIFIYRHRISYQVAITVKGKRGILPFSTNEEFWEKCAELQAEGKYLSCEYWYSLNDLFKGLYVVFVFHSFLSLWTENYFFFAVALILGFVSYRRSRQFAEYFVTTVVRNKK